MIAALNKLAQRLTATPQRAAPYSLIPSELKERAQWVIFALTPPDAKGKRKKKPLDPQTGEWSCTPNGPAIWLSFGDAVQLGQSTPAHFRNRVDGVGYVFTSDCPYAGIDLDDCYHGGKLDDRARAIVASLDTYTEISISGRGVKAIVKATVVVNPSLVRGVEVFGASGFFALTGKHLVGTPRTVNEAGRVVAALIQQFSPAPAHAAQNERSAAKAHNEQSTRPAITDNPIAAYNQAFDVSTIVERCGGKADGRKLYHCPCGVHTGASGSLLMKKSAKYGAVVRGLNPACIFHGRDSAAFDAMRFLEHGGNLTDAIKAARVALAMPIQGEKRPLAFAPKRPAPPAARIVENVNAVMSDVLSRAARDEGLKKSERRVLNTLIDHAPDGIARLSVQHVASLTGESESSVQRATRALNGRYFVKHEDSNEYGGNLANVYQFIKILTPPPVNNDEVSRSKHDFDTPLTLLESKGGDNLTHELNINHGAIAEQIPQSDPNQAEPALANAPPCLSPPAQPAAVATARPSLHAAIGDVLATSAQTFDASTGEITGKVWTVKRVTAALVATYGTHWDTPSIVLAYAEVRKQQSVAAFVDYRQRVAAMPTAALAKEAGAKAKTAVRSAGKPRESYHRAMDAIAQYELARRAKSPVRRVAPPTPAARPAPAPQPEPTPQPAPARPAPLANAALLNQAADLITAGAFVEYESLKTTYPDYDWASATDERYSYKQWRKSHNEGQPIGAMNTLQYSTAARP